MSRGHIWRDLLLEFQVKPALNRFSNLSRSWIYQEIVVCCHLLLQNKEVQKKLYFLGALIQRKDCWGKKMKILTRVNLSAFSKAIKASRELNFVLKMTWCQEGIEMTCMDSYNTCGIHCKIKMLAFDGFLSSESTTIDINNCEKCLKKIESLARSSCGTLLLSFDAQSDVQITENTQNTTKVLGRFNFITDPCRDYNKLFARSPKTATFKIDSEEICQCMLNLCIVSTNARILLHGSGLLNLRSHCEVGEVNVDKPLKEIAGYAPTDILCNLIYSLKFSKVLSLANSDTKLRIPIHSTSPLSLDFCLSGDTRMCLILTPLV